MLQVNLILTTLLDLLLTVQPKATRAKSHTLVLELVSSMNHGYTTMLRSDEECSVAAHNTPSGYSMQT